MGSLIENHEIPHFVVAHPEAITSDEWRVIQPMRAGAYLEGLRGSRSPQEISYFTRGGDWEAFRQSCIDPTREGRLLRDQSFDNPTAALAYIGNELVGFGLMADNTSGKNPAARRVKMLTTARRYALIREVVVRQDARRQHIASAIGSLMLNYYEEKQPVTAYTWEENFSGGVTAASFGLKPDMQTVPATQDEERAVQAPKTSAVQPFGPGSEPAHQLRWSAPSVKVVQAHILRFADCVWHGRTSQVSEMTQEERVERRKPLELY